MSYVWTNSPPTEPGDWWHRFAPDYPAYVRVVLCDLTVEYDGKFFSVRDLGGQWSSSPVPEPQEPSK